MNISNIEKQVIKLPNGTDMVSFDDFPTLNKDVRYIFVPNSCVWCSEYAFRNLPNLKGMWLPQSLTLIDKTALSGLDNLEYILVHNMESMETGFKGSQGYDYHDNFDGLFATYGLAKWFNQFHRNYHRKLDIISVKRKDRS